MLLCSLSFAAITMAKWVVAAAWCLLHQLCFLIAKQKLFKVALIHLYIIELADAAMNYDFTQIPHDPWIFPG